MCGPSSLSSARDQRTNGASCDIIKDQRVKSSSLTAYLNTPLARAHHAAQARREYRFSSGRQVRLACANAYVRRTSFARNGRCRRHEPASHHLEC